MKTFVALASGLVLLVSPTAARSGDPPRPEDKAGERTGARTGEEEWLDLDRELGRMAMGTRQGPEGLNWSVLIRGAFVIAHEQIATNNPPGTGRRQGADVAGVDFNDLDIALWGTIRQYGWRLSVDILGDDETSSNAQGGGNQGGLTFDTGDELQVEDAYAFWDWGNAFTVRVGNFKFPLTYSTGIDPENQLFLDRTAIGSFLDQWQAGVMFHGTWQLPEDVCGGTPLRWYLGIQDGVEASRINTATGVTGTVPPATGVQDSDSGSRWAFRLEYDMGNGVGAYEGARRSNDRFNATFGVGFAQYETHTASDSLITVDLNGDYRALGFGMEMADLGQSLGGPVSGDFGHLNLNSPLNMALAGNSQPWAMTLSYLITPEWEVGFRLENLDNDKFPVNNAPDAQGANNRILSYVINWYRAGNNAKWQFGYTTVDAERQRGGVRYDEGGYFQFGLTLGATR